MIFPEVNLNDAIQSQFVRDYLDVLVHQASWMENYPHNEQAARDRRHIIGVIELLDECVPYQWDEEVRKWFLSTGWGATKIICAAEDAEGWCWLWEVCGLDDPRVRLKFEALGNWDAEPAVSDEMREYMKRQTIPKRTKATRTES